MKHFSPEPETYRITYVPHPDTHFSWGLVVEVHDPWSPTWGAPLYLTLYNSWDAGRKSRSFTRISAWYWGRRLSRQHYRDTHPPVPRKKPKREPVVKTFRLGS